MNILQLLNNSKTQYHAVSECISILKANGFENICENTAFNVKPNGKYYVVRDGSALIAFTVGKNASSFKIVASHTDSPCFKVKLGNLSTVAGCTKLNVERYGGGLMYSWFDRPLRLAGRLCGEKNGKIVYQLYTDSNPIVIPSVAIHLRRNANEGFSVNAQTDCQPIYALDTDANALKKQLESAFDGKLLDCDLYLVCDEQPFTFGIDNKLACSPRVDNLTSCFSSIDALINASCDSSVNVAYLADNEEVGSRTKQGAGSKFLNDTLERIAYSIGKDKNDYLCMLANSFIVSCDNAHATHPNHPEFADKADEVILGGGIIIKHHANQNYTTDGMSSALFKHVLDNANVEHHDFYMRSDLPCGGTLGAISSSQLSIRSVDIGIAQLAMHSAVETFALKDFEVMTNGLKAFYNAGLLQNSFDEIIIS